MLLKPEPNVEISYTIIVEILNVKCSHFDGIIISETEHKLYNMNI